MSFSMFVHVCVYIYTHTLADMAQWNAFNIHLNTQMYTYTYAHTHTHTHHHADARPGILGTAQWNVFNI
jgi:hypothetical protein